MIPLAASVSFLGGLRRLCARLATPSVALCATLGAPACGAERAAIPPDAAPEPAPAADAAPPPPDAAPAFGEDVRSLRLNRSIAVRAAPAANADIVGTVARDIRVTWQGAAQGEGCDGRWIEIEPRGWICERYLEPSDRAPWGVEMPRLERGEVVPGVYGKVIDEGARTYVLTDEGLVEHRTLSGSVMVRRYAEAVLAPPQPAAGPGAAGAGTPEAPSEGPEMAPEQSGEAAPEQPEPGAEATQPATAARAAAGQAVAGAAPTGPTTYWLIDKRAREYLPSKHIREFQPSTFRGTRLDDDTGLALPVGFPMSRKRVSDPVPVHSAIQGGRVVRELESRVPVPVLEVVQDAGDKTEAYRIGDGEWVRAHEMRLAAATEPPPLTEPLERWFDIDLDQQVLVAYEGDLPVYATLISSGSRQHPTETGVYRIWIKFAETDMSDLAGESPYSVATVPWSQFFSKDLALHTAYWHDTFGTPRSHGCINLAPLDARFLYFWSTPQVPPGWSMAHGNVGHAGSMVRVRSQDDPSPELRGYAKRVHEARRARDPA